MQNGLAEAVSADTDSDTGSPNSQPLVGQAPDAFALTTTAGRAEDAENDEGAVVEPPFDPMAPAVPQNQFYSSGERKRSRAACVGCHERKLRCVMLMGGSCEQCVRNWRTCVPRVERKRGRPRAPPVSMMHGGPMYSGVNPYHQALPYYPPFPGVAPGMIPGAAAGMIPGMMAAGMIPGGMGGMGVYAAAAPVYAEQAAPPPELGGYVSLGASAPAAAAGSVPLDPAAPTASAPGSAPAGASAPPRLMLGASACLHLHHLHRHLTSHLRPQARR